MHNYASDITREEFEIIRKDLEGAKKATKPRKKDLYDIFCAILYLVKSGCQWRMLPADFPKFGIVRYYYDVWSKPRKDGTTPLSGVLKKISVHAGKRWPEEKQNDIRHYRRAKRPKRGHGG